MINNVTHLHLSYDQADSAFDPAAFNVRWVIDESPNAPVPTEDPRGWLTIGPLDHRITIFGRKSELEQFLAHLGNALHADPESA